MEVPSRRRPPPLTSPLRQDAASPRSVDSEETTDTDVFQRSVSLRLALLRDLRVQARAEAYLGPAAAKSWMQHTMVPWPTIDGVDVPGDGAFTQSQSQSSTSPMRSPAPRSPAHTHPAAPSPLPHVQPSQSFVTSSSREQCLERIRAVAFDVVGGDSGMTSTAVSTQPSVSSDLFVDTTSTPARTPSHAGGAVLSPAVSQALQSLQALNTPFSPASASTPTADGLSARRWNGGRASTLADVMNMVVWEVQALFPALAVYAGVVTGRGTAIQMLAASANSGMAGRVLARSDGGACFTAVDACSVVFARDVAAAAAAGAVRMFRAGDVANRTAALLTRSPLAAGSPSGSKRGVASTGALLVFFELLVVSCIVSYFCELLCALCVVRCALCIVRGTCVCVSCVVLV